MNKFIDIKYENLDSDICNIIQKYYSINEISKFNLYVQDNVLFIKNLNEYIYFDKNIQFPGDVKFKIKWENFEDNQFIEPKFEKIISRYYDLNKIEYSIDGKCVIINNNNLLERIYFDELIKKDTIKYYNILYENIEKHESVVFIIQVGKWDTLEKMYHNLDIIGEVDANCIIAVVENEYDDEKIDAIKTKIKNLVIIEVKNKGMDIGVFLLSLLYLRDNDLNYDYLIKIHTKTDDRFREHVCEHLIGSKKIIDSNINILRKDPNIGMLNGTLTFNYHKNKQFYDNHFEYLEYFCNLLLDESININKLEFAVGTFFYSKFDVFDIFNKNHIKLIYNQLNDFESLDKNWYAIFYNLKHKSDSFIKQHYLKNKHKNHGNNLELQRKTNCSGMRDFMIEHALERFFGYLNKNKKYTMIEV